MSSPTPTSDVLASADAYPVVYGFRPRFADMGPDGGVALTAIARWFEDVRVAMDFPRLTEAAATLGEMPQVLLAAQDLDCPHRLSWDREYRIGAGIRRVGRSSFTTAYAVFDGDECLATGESATVFTLGGTASELPGVLREDLAELMLPDLAAPERYAPDPRRRDRSTYPFRTPIRSRIGDLDANRHVNNVAVVTWYYDAVATLTGTALSSGWGGPPPELAPTSYRVQYVAEIGYPAEYELAVVVLGWGEEVVHYGLAIFEDDRCVGLADAVGARGDLPADALEKWSPGD